MCFYVLSSTVTLLEGNENRKFASGMVFINLLNYVSSCALPLDVGATLKLIGDNSPCNVSPCNVISNYYVVTTTSCIRVEFSVTAKNYAFPRGNLIHTYHPHPHHHPLEMR